MWIFEKNSFSIKLLSKKLNFQTFPRRKLFSVFQSLNLFEWDQPTDSGRSNRKRNNVGRLEIVETATETKNFYIWKFLVQGASTIGLLTHGDLWLSNSQKKVRLLASWTQRKHRDLENPTQRKNLKVPSFGRTEKHGNVETFLVVNFLLEDNEIYGVEQRGAERPESSQWDVRLHLVEVGKTHQHNATDAETVEFGTEYSIY